MTFSTLFGGDRDFIGSDVAPIDDKGSLLELVHAHTRVKPDCLAVEVGALDEAGAELAKLLGRSETLRIHNLEES